MDIINKANILDQEDLLLLENHSLDTTYYIAGVGNLKGIPKLFLLVNFLDKYTEINDVIKNYLKYYSAEVNTFGHNLNALDICIMKYEKSPCLETIKILLEYGTNINLPNNYASTSFDCALEHFNYHVVKLMLEYDGVDTKDITSFYTTNEVKKKYFKDYRFSIKDSDEFNRLARDINLLNTKN